MQITDYCVDKILDTIDVIESPEAVDSFVDSLLSTESLIDSNPDVGGFLCFSEEGDKLFSLLFGRKHAMLYTKGMPSTMIDVVAAVEVL